MRTTQSLQYGAVPWDDQPVVIERLTILDHFQGKKGSTLVLRIITCSSYEFVFPACNASTKATTHGCPECPSHCSIPQGLLLILEPS